MLQFDGMLMTINRPWSISVRDDPVMTRFFREFVNPVNGITRHLIRRRPLYREIGIWFYLTYRNDDDSAYRECAFWVTPWGWRESGYVFVPAMVRKIQRCARLCSKNRRRKMVLEALEIARSNKERNLLTELPYDLLHKCVLDQL